jgi:hypothetical protein
LWNRHALCLEAIEMKRHRALHFSLDVLGGGLTYPMKALVAEESDKNDDHDRREKDLATGDKEGRREQQ